MSEKYNQWTIVNDKSQQIVNFTSFLSFEMSAGGQVVSEPIEMGSFAAYNKTAEPIEIYVSLGVSGTPDVIQAAIDAIQKAKESTDLYSVITPEQEYQKLSVESYSYKRTRDEGANVLFVELHLIEVKEVSTEYTTNRVLRAKQVKNSDNASTSDQGKKQAKTAAKVAAEKLDNIFNDKGAGK